MLVTLSGIVTLVSELQSLNTKSPILVTPSPIVTLVSESQQENVLSPIFVTLFGIVTLIRELQYLNASSPMLVTPSPIVTLVSEPQLLNAEPIFTSSPDIVTLLIEEQLLKVLSAIPRIPNKSKLFGIDEEYPLCPTTHPSTNLIFEIDVVSYSLSHLLKAWFPIFMTLFGIMILSNSTHPVNAESPMLNTPSGITIFLIKQSANAPGPMLVTPLGILTFVLPEGQAINLCPSLLSTIPSTDL